MKAYSREMVATWVDMDMNAHMRNTAYLDKAGDLRLFFFEDHGYSVADFAREGFGPVILHEELDYQREIGLMERYVLSLELVGISPGGERFSIRNLFTKLDGRSAGRVLSSGGWLDFQTRKFRRPPDGLLLAIESMPRASDFRVLDLFGS